MISLVNKLDIQIEELCVPQRDLAGCVDWLNQAYQTGFLVWEWQEHWQAQGTPPPHMRTDHEIAINYYIDQIPAETRFQLLAVDAQHALVVIPIEAQQTPQILVGILPRACATHLPPVLKLLLKQKHQSRMVIEQHRLLEHYASYAAIDFEELSWFGTLVENMSFVETDHGLTNSARQALLGLKDFIQAESLSVVLCEAPVSGKLQGFKRIATLGERKLNDATVTALLKLAGPNYFCESYLNNFVQEAAAFKKTGIESVVIIPAMCNHRCFGWLIAINRQPLSTQQEGGRSIPAQRWQQFNTKTALLMEAAASVLATHAHNLLLLSDQQTLLIGTVRSLVNTIDTKDKYTCGHSDRVAQIAKSIAQEYGLSEQDCQKIYLAGLLHDIGKIGVRDEVLMKPGQLTPEEFNEIKLHPVFGYEILKHLNQLAHVLPGVMHHHESWDGTGYPHKLSGKEIPLAARILAVADAYDAMTSDRPYRRGMAAAKAEQVLRQGAGQQWDPAVVAAFFRIIEKVHRIIVNKSKRSYLPVNRAEYVFEDDFLEHEDLVQSAIKTTTSLSDVK